MSGSVGRARLRRLVENWNCTAVRTFSEMLNFIKLNCTVKSGPFYRNWDGVVGSRLPWNWIIVARRERSTNWYQPQVTILRSYVFRHFSDDELPPAASRPHSSQTEITLIMFVCNPDSYADWSTLVWAKYKFARNGSIYCKLYILTCLYWTSSQGQKISHS